MCASPNRPAAPTAAPSGLDFIPRSGGGLRRDGKLPLYHQIREIIKQQIRDGVLKAGSQLPSEDDLTREFGVTRATLRQAISSLVTEGLVYRRHGKGTFVGEPKVARRFARLTGFSEDVVARGHQPGARMLALRRGPVRAEVAQALGLRRGEPAVLVHRLRTLDGRPAAVQWSFVPSALAPGLETAGDFPSLYAYLEARYGLTLNHASQVIEVRRATVTETRLLHLRPQAPVAQVTRTTYLDDGRPVEYARMVYRGDLFRFEMQLWRMAL